MSSENNKLKPIEGTLLTGKEISTQNVKDITVALLIGGYNHRDVVKRAKAMYEEIKVNNDKN